MKDLSRRTADFTDSVIRRMTRISNRYGAVNLSQGFPDFDPPKALLDRLAHADAQQQAEFINIFYGEDVPEEEAQKALACFQAACPNAEITLLSGGQPVYYYLISAE